MIEGTYNINFLYNENITGHISGRYSTPDNRYGLETITVDDYYFGGSMNNYTIEYSTDKIYCINGYDYDNIDWLVAVASVKTDLVFDFGNSLEFSYNSYDFVFSTKLLRHANNTITLRFKANNIIFHRRRVTGISYNINVILDCETLTSYDDFYMNGILILTDRLKDINCVELRGNIGLYNLSNLEHIGKHSFKNSNLIVMSQSKLPNEMVYNFTPTIIEDKYEGIQVLKQWNLIKFADNCIIEDEAFENASMNIPPQLEDVKMELYNTIFDLCNISNESGKDVFKNFGTKGVDKEKNRRTLFKVKNTLKIDFFGELYDKVYAYCEDEQFIRTVINKLIRPYKFIVQFYKTDEHDILYRLDYELKYTPNINTNVTLCCDVNCLEYGVGHYTAEMTDDLNIDHKTLCVGCEKTNKYYRIKED